MVLQEGKFCRTNDPPEKRRRCDSCPGESTDFQAGRWLPLQGRPGQHRIGFAPSALLQGAGRPGRPVGAAVHIGTQLHAARLRPGRDTLSWRYIVVVGVWHDVLLLEWSSFQLRRADRAGTAPAQAPFQAWAAPILASTAASSASRPAEISGAAWMGNWPIRGRSISRPLAGNLKKKKAPPLMPRWLPPVVRPTRVPT